MANRISVREAAKKAIDDLRLPIHYGDGAALLGYCIHLMLESDNLGASLYDLTGDIKDFNTIVYNRNDFYRMKQEAERGEVAMHFVDRAGDVHPGIDDAETICNDFYKAMITVLDRQWGR